MPELKLTKRIKAPVRKVFEAVVQPELIMLWIGPAGATVVEVVSEPHVGGRFRLRMVVGPGSYYAVEGEYLTVEPDRRLVMRWVWVEFPDGDGKSRDDTTLEFDFKQDGDSTIVCLTHSGLPSQPVADDHGRGWNEGLEKLRRVVERNRGGDLP